MIIKSTFLTLSFLTAFVVSSSAYAWNWSEVFTPPKIAFTAGSTVWALHWIEQAYNFHREKYLNKNVYAFSAEMNKIYSASSTSISQKIMLKLFTPAQLGSIIYYSEVTARLSIAVVPPLIVGGILCKKGWL